MSRVLVLIVGLLGLTVWAQESSQPDRMQAGQSAGEQAKEVTVSGCLQQSGAYLYLTQDDRTKIQVRGSKVDEHKGHEVEISGERSSKTIDTTAPSAACSATLNPLIDVKSVKDLGTRCSRTFH